jgi:iron complex outermembrane receptor protein
VSSTNDTGANGTTTPAIHVGSYVAWDIRVGYDWHLDDKGFLKIIKLAVGVNNISDRMPPLAPRAFTDNNADVSTFSPIGRLTYASVSVDF